MKRRTLWLLLAVMSIPALCFAPAVQTARAEDPHIVDTKCSCGDGRRLQYLANADGSMYDPYVLWAMGVENSDDGGCYWDCLEACGCDRYDLDCSHSCIIGERPVPPPATQTRERTLSMVGYDGTDTKHLPLTFVVEAKEDGRALAHEDVGFRFGGDVQCLADQYATWDAESRTWQPLTQNLAADQTLLAATDANGQLVLRTVLDFGRMGLFGKKLPCTIELRAAIRAASGDSIIEQRTQTTIRHPVFISDIFFKSGNDPVYPGNSRWIRTRLLDTFPFWQHTIDGYGTKVAVGESYRAYPNPRDINSRIYLRAPDAHETDWVSFQPPSSQTDYFYPVSGGTSLLISLGDPPNTLCGTCQAAMSEGDGIAVAVLWADGTRGLFAQTLETERFAWVTFGDGSHYGATTSEVAGWDRFAVNQACDVLIKAGAVGTATWLGGPAAGAWTALLVDTWQTTSTIAELVEMGRSKKLIVFRSEASVTSAVDGTITLYNFSGAPSVLDDAGNEVLAGEGEAVTFTYEGPIQPATAQDPPAAAQLLQDALSAEPGPESVPVSSELPVTSPDAPMADVPWVPLAVGAAGLLGVGALAVAIKRSRRPRQHGPVRCLQCGSPAQTGARFCGNCGRPLR